MVNPFAEFQTYQPRTRTLPLDRIIAARDAILDQLVSGYEHFIANTDLDWDRLPDLQIVDHAYGSAAQRVTGLEYAAEDIEDFCFTMEQLHTPAPHQLPDDSPSLWGLSGLYLSALCNHVADDKIQLRLNRMPARVHLVGYKLPAGKHLSIEGLCGDFLGMALAGGEISLHGSAFYGVGCGLQQGKIMISDNAGEDTGQGMVGGEIHVIGGRIRGIGQVQGGKVYLGERLVAPDWQRQQEQREPKDA